MTDAKALPVFKTMVPVTHPDIVKALTGWRQPRTAYILMECPQLNIIGEGQREWGMGLVTYNAESRAEIMGWVENTLSKGGRVLHYDNFPKLNDSKSSRVEKALLYGGGKGANPWDILARQLDTHMARDLGLKDTIAQQKEEIDALHAKLAALEAAKPAVAVSKKDKEKESGSLYTEK